jgi:hypothetical protein
MASSIFLDSYRRHWPRLGGVLAMGLGGALALASINNKLSRSQMISAPISKRTWHSALSIRQPSRS